MLDYHGHGKNLIQNNCKINASIIILHIYIRSMRGAFGGVRGESINISLHYRNKTKTIR